MTEASPQTESPSTSRVPLTLGDLIYIRSNKWDGLRPGVVVDIVEETPGSGKATVFANVMVNGLKDADMLAEFRRLYQGNTVEITAMGNVNPPMNATEAWFIGLPNANALKMGIISEMHREVTDCVASFNERVATTGTAIHERLDQLEKRVAAFIAPAAIAPANTTEQPASAGT